MDPALQSGDCTANMPGVWEQGAQDMQGNQTTNWPISQESHCISREYLTPYKPLCRRWNRGEACDEGTCTYRHGSVEATTTEDRRAERRGRKRAQGTGEAAGGDAVLLPQEVLNITPAIAQAERPTHFDSRMHIPLPLQS